MKLQDEFNDWVYRNTAGEEVPDNIVALNFGLNASEHGYRICMIGSHDYDPKDPFWIEYKDFVPGDKVFYKPLNKEQGIDDWKKAVNKSEELLKGFMESPSYRQSWVKKLPVVTTGYHDEELTRVK